MTRKKDWWLYPCAVIGAGCYVTVVVWLFQLMHSDAIRTGVLK